MEMYVEKAPTDICEGFIQFYYHLTQLCIG